MLKMYRGKRKNIQIKTLSAGIRGKKGEEIEGLLARQKDRGRKASNAWVMKTGTPLPRTKRDETKRKCKCVC